MFYKFNLTTVKYALVNKFLYHNLKELPKLEKIILSLNFTAKSDMKIVAVSMLALELISVQRGKIIQIKKPSILLKVKKGNLTGCRVTLRKKNMFLFLGKILVETFPKLKNFEGIIFCLNNKIQTKSFFFEFPKNSKFNEIEKHNYLFNDLSHIKVTLIANFNTQSEFLCILTSLKLPLVIGSENTLKCKG
jgi:large subunit ribosomal protein L5